MRAWLLLLALAGCDRVFGLGDPYEDANVDGPRPFADAPGHDDATSHDVGTDGGDTLQPIAYFPFDTDFNNAVDGTPGLCANGCTLGAGHTGAGLALDGGCVQTTLVAEPPELTIAFWARPSSTALSPLVARKWTSVGSHFSWRVFMGGAGGQSLGFALYDGGTNDTIKLTATVDFVTGEWHHYAVTFDGTFKTLYVDGAMKAQQQTLAVAYLDKVVTIGCEEGGTDFYFGDIDELRIYNFAMSGAQISELGGQ
jgi:hypothetical protein